MTNAEYQTSRSLDHPFTATPEQARAAWFAMNKGKILKRRKVDDKFKDNPARKRVGFEMAYEDE